ncbi:hypothetical protein HBI25_181850 [Parastagonospora nodorum]|nr:hypothetical protein HBH51_171210 [Parastagonospora nodorum]KAH4043258.1 hypothetical protein HBH49_234960 [Parastagonospora nodorum]KAH4112360.1 hypothetical protein HBH47_226650 [Parastagonospora nodorum]KAH4153853.1 hypothetical protein HBH43_221950 [Parastagonospora nodorum]KAH4181894.1 hypothetical protein HBH42_229100 [Parastagonospora nodorum]
MYKAIAGRTLAGWKLVSSATGFEAKPHSPSRREKTSCLVLSLRELPPSGHRLLGAMMSQSQERAAPEILHRKSSTYDDLAFKAIFHSRLHPPHQYIHSPYTPPYTHLYIKYYHSLYQTPPSTGRASKQNKV